MYRVLAIVSVIGLSAAALSAEVVVQPSTSGRPEITNVGEAASFSRPSRPARRRAEPATAHQVSSAELSETIRAAARKHDLDPALVEAVIEAESAWDVRAVSRHGAQGLMQIMPATARDLSLGRPFDPVENVQAGTAYLRQMMDRFDGRVELALAAYNAGPSTVEAYGGVPPFQETVTYVRRVLALWLGDAAPVVVPASRRLPGAAAQRAPARPVHWRSDGKRPHLTNIK